MIHARIHPATQAALDAFVWGASEPRCDYCETTGGLRITSREPWGQERPAGYICEDCFTGTDDGPCFDDLEPVADTAAEIGRRHFEANRNGGDEHQDDLNGILGDGE